MTTITIAYGGQQIHAEVFFSDRSTLDISVMPGGDVVVTAPRWADTEQVRLRTRRRASWILRQQTYFAQFRPRTPERRWVPGETHRYLGRQYRLRIGDTGASAPHVRITKGFLLIDGTSYEDSAAIERAIRGWWRKRTHVVIERRLPTCAARFDIPITPTAVTVREMTSRWASMSAAGRLTINPDLLRAPTDAIDYVLTHELGHLIVPDHGPRFTALLDEVMPDHAARKRRLERATA